MTKYSASLVKCEEKFEGKWTSLTQKAADALDPCPDGLAQQDVKDVLDECVANVQTGLAGGGLVDCSGDLVSCEGDLGTCQGDLGTCNGDLSTCNSDLGTCTTDLTTAEVDLTTCEGNLVTALACGNGAVDAGEDCDFGDLNGATCVSIGEGFISGTLGCGAGCVFDTSGCQLPHILFRTQNSYTGNMGGLAGADSFCQGLADGAGLQGTFKAALSTSVVNARDRFIDDGRPVHNTLGVVIKSSLTALFDAVSGIPAASLRPDASGAATNPNGRTWTGSLTGGVINPGNTCSDWTSTGGAGWQGTADGTGVTWMNQQSEGCTGTRAIYCIGS